MKAFTRLQLATLVAKGWVPEIVACHSVSVKGPQVKSKISVGFDRYAVHAYTACWRSGILRLSWAVDDITGHSRPNHLAADMTNPRLLLDCSCASSAVERKLPRSLIHLA